MNYLKKYNKQIFILIILIFHTVGILGVSSDSYKNEILKLSGFNLILSFLVVLLSSTKRNQKLFIFILITYIIGFIVELIGVHTGILFGDYSYGKNLGIKMYDVPLVIGINWVFLSIITGNISSYLSKNIYLKTLIGAGFMVLLDFLIEPIAIKSDYWSWQYNKIPAYNYICWYFISIPIQFLFQKLKLSEQNIVHLCLYIVLVLFFVIQLI